MYKALLLVTFLATWVGECWSQVTTRDALIAIRDAQAGNMKRYLRGSLDAECEDLNTVNETRQTAAFHLDWEGPNAYWKYTIHNLDPETGKSAMASSINCEQLVTEGDSVAYSPKHRYCSIAPLLRFSLNSPLLELRPENSWYDLSPFVTKKKWFDVVDYVLEKDPPQTTVEVDESIVTIYSGVMATGVKSEYHFDLRQGGNATVFRMTPYTQGATIISGYHNTFSWVSDEIGGFRLHEYEGIQYLTNIGVPQRKIKLKITRFDPEPQFSANRFKRESIVLPVGTQIEEHGANPNSKPKTRTVGGQRRERMPKEVLDRLSTEARKQGFADPARSKK